MTLMPTSAEPSQMLEELIGHTVEVKDVNGNIYRGTLIAIQHENLNVTLKEVDISGKEKAPLVLIRGNRVHHIKLTK